MFQPKVGQVIRYDFLWHNDAEKGAESGKDRPCSIIVARQDAFDHSHLVLVCPITHSPPDDPSKAVELPPAVSKHLGLDQERSWIKTDQVNQFRWDRRYLPIGVQPVEKGRWIYGDMPSQLSRQAHDQVRAAAHAKQLHNTLRHDEDDAAPAKSGDDEDATRRPIRGMRY